MLYHHMGAAMERRSGRGSLTIRACGHAITYGQTTGRARALNGLSRSAPRARGARARGCGVLGDARRTPHAPPPLTAFASAFPLTFRSSLVVTLYDAVTVFAVLSRVIGTTSNK